MKNLIVTSCGNSEKLAKKIAEKLGVRYFPLVISQFPDGDIYLRFKTVLKNKELIIVQSFQPEPDRSLFKVIFAAETAKELEASKVILAAPYLAYMRQDKMFNAGECISSKVMAKLLNSSIDEVITIDPHLHRYKSLKDIFTIPAKRLSANSLIGEYIKKHFKEEVIIGPDWESYQWAEKIAEKIKVHAMVLKKSRFSSRHVEVKMTQPIEIKGKKAVIVDDIISTGHTVIEAAKQARKLGAKSVAAICVHGLLVEGAAEKLKKEKIEVISTNTIEHSTNKIDISSLLVEALRKEN